MKNIFKAQFFKFAITGILNTSVDFIILNFILFFSSKTLIWFMIAKTFAFMGATTNSFILNRKWTFKSSKEYSDELIPFIVISCMALLINVTSASVLFHLLTNYLSPLVTANVSAVAASLFAFSCNYFGYKYIVFKKRN